ncbi:hypothetical protein HDV00_006056 [Rhizophlyctis rosea]|nr:hypothetical protein HDV00_006056 [Rhizophlyctis rosea]
MFGKWATACTFGDPECLFEPGWQLTWFLYPHIEGGKVIFRCQDNVVPLGIGWQWVTVKLTATGLGLKNDTIPLIHRKRLIFKQPGRGLVDSPESGDWDEVIEDDDSEDANSFPGWKAWPGISVDGDKMYDSFEDEVEEGRKGRRKGKGGKGKGKKAMRPEEGATPAGPSTSPGNPDATITHNIRCGLRGKVTEDVSAVSFNHVEKDLHYVVLDILRLLVKEELWRNPRPPPPKPIKRASKAKTAKSIPKKSGKRAKR